MRRNSFLANLKGVIFSCTLLSVIFFCITGSDVVDWLYSHVEGFQDRREARKYACNLLKVNALFELDLLLLLSFFLVFLLLFFCDVLFASHICLYMVVYQAGFIRHTVNKITFSEQCYYVFGDLCGSKS